MKCNCIKCQFIKFFFFREETQFFKIFRYRGYKNLLQASESTPEENISLGVKVRQNRPLYNYFIQFSTDFKKMTFDDLSNTQIDVLNLDLKGILCRSFEFCSFILLYVGFVTSTARRSKGSRLKEIKWGETASFSHI